MSGKTFLSLPNEIIRCICATLCSHCEGDSDVSVDPPCGHNTLGTSSKHERVRSRKATLAGLCRTSRRIYDIAMPILYHTYFDTNPPMHSVLRYFMFMRTLRQRPDLAAGVRRAAFYEYSDVFEYHKPSVDELAMHLGAPAPRPWPGPSQDLD